jgi:predicted metal-dependent hydrolase
MHVEPARPIHVRRMDFPFDRSIPKHWFGGSAVATHAVNAINLLFPAGERFFVRSVHHFLDRIEDAELLREVKAFAGQEGQHAREHERYFELLEAQGYRIRGFLRRYQDFCYTKMEKLFSPELRLAATAACEHFTAIMAENALGKDLLEGAHPTMQALLKWHACEEIEHKAVAFDVLARVNPSYRLRMAGLALSSVTLGAFWIIALHMFLQQDGLSKEQVRHQIRELHREEPILKNVFWRGIREYARRDFHPWDNDNSAIAKSYLASIGRGAS